METDDKFKVNGGYIYLDEFNNIRYSSDFELSLGKISQEYRFIPNSQIVIEQGLTAQILLIIAEIIKDKYNKENFNS